MKRNEFSKLVQLRRWTLTSYYDTFIPLWSGIFIVNWKLMIAINRPTNQNKNSAISIDGNVCFSLGTNFFKSNSNKKIFKI